MLLQQPVVYAEVPGAQHTFETTPSVRTHATVHAVERFLAVVRTRSRRPDTRRGGRDHGTQLTNTPGHAAVSSETGEARPRYRRRDQGVTARSGGGYGVVALTLFFQADEPDPG